MFCIITESESGCRKVVKLKRTLARDYDSVYDYDYDYDYDFATPKLC